MNHENFFEGIPQTEVKTGEHVNRYPVFYREISYMSVFLLAPLQKIRALLPSERMYPFRITPWHGIFTITVTEYKDSDVGAYNQVSVGIPFMLDKQTHIFTGIIHKVPETPLIYTFSFPVTTVQALSAGIEMANYPEFLADIQFTKVADRISCNAKADGKNILKFSAKVIPLKTIPRQKVFPVTLKNGQLLRSTFHFSEARAGISKRSSDVKLEFGDHPLGQQLQKLYSVKVLQYQYYPSGQAILYPPEVEHHENWKVDPLKVSF